jgi:hypothetical protein
MRGTALGVLLLAATASAEADHFGLGNGQDGDVLVASNMVLNAYAQLMGDAPRAATRLLVSDPAPFRPGHLLMLHQTVLAQDPPLPGADGSYDLTADGVGRFELARVASIDGTTLVLTAPLDHGFPALATQLVTVPELHTLHITNIGVVSPLPWNGTTGGIVALLIQTTFALEGNINANASGFRAGMPAVDPTNSKGCTSPDEPAPRGGAKGEGIERWRYGSTGFGRSLNGGGGGDCNNAGGGGGANQVVGGHGGDDTTGNAVGGQGGAACAFSPLWHLTFGGGGGAGHGGTVADSWGGAGGGIVFVRTGPVSGMGTIESNGDASPMSVDNGSGGAGAGGTVMLRVSGLLSCIAINAEGGEGANSNLNYGGGGGGGASGRVFLEAMGSPCIIRDFGGPCDGTHFPDGGGTGGNCQNGDTVGPTVITTAYDPTAAPIVDPWPLELDGGVIVVQPDGGTITAVPPRFLTTPNPVAFCGAPYRYSTEHRPEIVGDGPLTFSLSGNVPMGASVNATTGELSWTPSRSTSGEQTFTLAVDGPGGHAEQTVVVDVECPDAPTMRTGCGCDSTMLNMGVALVLAALRRRNCSVPRPTP